jgi:hypothetical protein
MSTYMGSIGGFEHEATLAQTGQLNGVLKVLWASQPFGMIGSIPGKIAIGLTLLRILGPTASKAFTWFLYTLFALTVVIGVVTLLLQFFQCNPSYALWTPGIPAKCMNPAIEADFAIFSGGTRLSVCAYD